MTSKRCSHCKREIGQPGVRCPYCGVRPGEGARVAMLVIVPMACAALGALAAMRGSEPGRAVLDQGVTAVRSRLGFAPAVAQAPVAQVVDLRSIARRDAAAVAAVLGHPSRSETATNGDKQYPAHFYRDGRLEVVFVRGRAEWITITALDGIPYGPHVLRAFGLPDTEPAFASVDVIRWQDVAGVKEITIFPARGSRGIEYASIFVSSEP